MGKGETANFQHFLFFPQCFKKPSETGSWVVLTIREQYWKPRYKRPTTNIFTRSTINRRQILHWSKLKKIADGILKVYLKWKISGV